MENTENFLISCSKGNSDEEKLKGDHFPLVFSYKNLLCSFNRFRVFYHPVSHHVPELPFWFFASATKELLCRLLVASKGDTPVPIKHCHIPAIMKIATMFLSATGVDSIPKNFSSILVSFQCLTMHLIDETEICKMCLEKSGFVFDFYISEDIWSDDLFSTIISHNSKYWLLIKDYFYGTSDVKLEIVDRYIQSPLACLLVVDFVEQLQKIFKLSYKSVVFSFSNRDFHPIKDADPNLITTKFSSQVSRNIFFNRCQEAILHEHFKLVSSNVSHLRRIRLSTKKYHCDIRIDGGISYGWGLTRKDNFNKLTLQELDDNLTMNLHLYNRERNRYDKKGILYTVSAGPNENE